MGRTVSTFGRRLNSEVQERVKTMLPEKERNALREPLYATVTGPTRDRVPALLPSGTMFMLMHP